MTGWTGQIRPAAAGDCGDVAGLAAEGCALVALATRRAAPFYRAIGYEESAVYFRKLLPLRDQRAAAGMRGIG